jgi:methyl-accepting chemotaxis protein
MFASFGRSPSAPRSPRRWAKRLRILIIRIVAIIACVVGVTGIIASVVAYQRIGQIERSAQNELRQISNNFTLIANSLTTVSGSATNAADSVTQTRQSLTTAANTTRSTADTLDQTAGVINFAIPGTTIRPLAGVDTNFRDEARQLRILATNVDQTNAILEQNVTDLNAISGDVAAISQQMSDIAAQLRRLSGENDGTLVAVANSARLLMIWSVILHGLLMALGICLALLTIEERPVEALVVEEFIAISQ